MQKNTTIEFYLTANTHGGQKAHRKIVVSTQKNFVPTPFFEPELDTKLQIVIDANKPIGNDVFWQYKSPVAFNQLKGKVKIVVKLENLVNLPCNCLEIIENVKNNTFTLEIKRLA